MDAYEATRVVFSRIQAMDPDNATKIMGLLLIQEHGEKEMIRLAFGPESLLHSVVLNARNDLGLLPHTNPSPFILAGRQTSSSRLPPPLTVTSPPSWAPPHPFSRSNSGNNGSLSVVVDNLQNSGDELISPTTNPANSPFYGGGDLIDEFQLQDQLSFSAAGMGWGMNGHLHRRSYSVTDISDPAGFGWRPCLYFAKGYCKNGTTCRFLHGLPDDPTVEQQCNELLLRSKSQRLMASAPAFPYSPTASLPSSPSSKCMNFLLQQQQQNESPRAAALMLGGDETHKFMGRSRIDFAGMVNPSSRQIYLTFPADSTFREEDVSNYFSIYGPVQDVRIPYQQKRMFGFVTFVYPETVKLILAKGNPHFVCDSRVLVKPYKEKGKVPDKYRKLQQTGDFSGCSSPTGLDHRDPFDLQLGSRMLYGSCSTQDLLLRRKMEEQQQAADLQQAIELQGRRFMGLHLLDLKNRSLPAMSSSPAITVDARSSGGSQDGSPPGDQRPSPTGDHELVHQAAVNASDKQESGGEASPNVDSDFQESVEHNLPDSPFASPTKASILADPFTMAAMGEDDPSASSPALSCPPLFRTPVTLQWQRALEPTCNLSSRFSSGHGAVGM